MLNTPILLIAFNRPKTTRQVFEQIRKVKPKQFFLAIDGKRNESDALQIQQILDLTKEIDWDCEVKVLQQAQNLGCGLAPAQAISWFLAQNPYGIILEDDCLPNQSFFFFCEELLQKYEHDTRIMQISGTNYITEWQADKYDYFCSMFGGCWGWATWQRAWQYFDYQLIKWNNPDIKRQIQHFWHYEPYINYHQKIYDKTIQSQGVDWWDYQWSFARILQNGLAISPSKNLVSNIGTDTQATHTQGDISPFTHLPTFELDFPLKPGEFMGADEEYDLQIYQKIAPPELTIRQRIQRKYSYLTKKQTTRF